MVRYILLFWCIIITLKSESQNLTFKAVTTQSGLTHSTVYAITQDEKGFLWFGTREGLNRFDSHEIKNYYLKGESSNSSANQINALLSDKNALYIGTDNGLFLYSSVLDSIKNISPVLNRAVIYNLYKSNGIIFICSSLGLYQLLPNHEVKPLIKGQPVRAISEISKHTFLIALKSRVWIINRHGDWIKELALEGISAPIDRELLINALYKDRQGIIWLGSTKGLFNYKLAGNSLKKINLNNATHEGDMIRTITGGSKNKIWVGTEAGLYIYNKDNLTSTLYTQSFTRKTGTLTDKSIYSSFTSKDGIVWLGTYFGGINYTATTEKGFFKLLPDDSGQGLSGKAVSQIIEDQNGVLWIGTEDGGITLYDRKKNLFSPLKHEIGNPNSLSTNNVHSLHDDRLGNIWIGTFMGGLNKYNTKTKQFTIYSHSARDSRSLSNNSVYAILKDSRGTLWVGTQGGLNTYDYAKDHFNLFKPEIFRNLFIYDILEDKKGDLWFCSREKGIFHYNVGTNSIHHYHTGSPAGKRLSSNKIISASQDAKGHLWFGTLNGGMMQWNAGSKHFRHFTMAQGLSNNNVYGVLEDPRGTIWFTTNKGLSKLNPATNKIVNFTNLDGLPTNQFNFKSFLKDKNGYLYFGTINGLCYFNEKSIQALQSPSPIHFTNFRLFNKRVAVGENAVLKKQIDDTYEIILPYNNNVLTIDFSNLNFHTGGSRNYTYFLEGFEKTWNSPSNSRSATYTNLSPGSYLFRVKNSYSENKPAVPERTLKITINPPFYLSNAAYIIYGLLLLLAIYAYTRFIKFIHQQKLAVQIEKLEKEKAQEISFHQLNFFTFISHEFKTPLTLIIASADKLVQEFSVLLEKNNDLKLLKSNASRLYGLIEQLMEFRNAKSDHSKIELQKSDLIDYLNEVFYTFTPLCQNRSILYQYSISHSAFPCFFDKNKIEKIVFNILSNAIKNTPSHGKITISATITEPLTEEGSPMLEMSFSDTGKGMTEEELERAFQLFYQGGSNKSKGNGSGIGLTLVKSLIKLLKGSIEINSKINLGTTVSISLPLHLTTWEQKPELLIKQEESTISESETLTELVDIEEQPSKAHKSFTLLIVEDNKELLNFLASHFSSSYKIITANSGLPALKRIEKSLPDLIVSDVNMPDMNGIELCIHIKSNPRTNHIPVVLLSESASDGSRLKGLDVGAEAYLCKPFHLKELELLLNNIIQSHVNTKEQYANLKNLGFEKLPRNNQTDEFINRLITYVEDNYKNPNLTIEEIANEVGMSRSSLHIKIKKVFNLNPSEFLNEHRLKRAKVLLDNDLPIAEAAFFSGYADPSYFSRVFKKYYHITPSEYKEEYLKKTKSLLYQVKS